MPHQKNSKPRISSTPNNTEPISLFNSLDFSSISSISDMSNNKNE